ncbi:WD repeat-containing protein on Y chromosome-like [Siniperca chuatsi]|uniref:WD repeat-containing protein on Y chromosome-like n=1 Tax=Siniperca chuatsi TaxID=119488 RepID=UPI001CE1BAA0|nr:WD repeat-containing protein on Y chromosome-like [Siniperca chuatsi]
MESDTETEEDLPEEAPIDSEPTKADKMFTAKDIPRIVKLFREADADGGGGLDIEEFCVAMQQLYTTVNKEELIVLHMQIDTNCDKTVDLGELLDFLLNKNMASDNMDFNNKIFPKPIKMIPVDYGKPIIRLLFRPYEHDSELDHGSGVSKRQTRTYQKGQYLSITSDGTLNFWTDSFDTPYTITLYKTQKALPFSHVKKMCVSDMVYLRELKQLAISTSDRELLFYHCNEFPNTFEIVHALIVEDNTVNTMNYWSDGTKAVFFFGDIKGVLSVFISHNVQKNGLFCAEAYEKISLQKYRTVYVSALLKNPSKHFLCVKFPIFNDICSQSQYFPLLDSFAICSSSSKTMVLAALPKLARTKVSKKVFESSGDQEFFTCVEYAPSAGRLVTGGTDGLLRVWFLHNTLSCELALKGHVKPITHIMFNREDKVFVTLSEDKNIRVWSEDGWLCKQSFHAQDMGRAPISSVCYNINNNELFLANSDIGKYLGRGTDVFQDTLTSHDKPLCCVLYHSIFKQVVSVCQNGVVTVWDILKGKAIMQFKVTPHQHVGFTAMSFDGPQRRIITVSQDGKMRLWNFNNGTELEVLPVTVQREVTGIVCINNRVFVSGRNSKIIFDLDLVEDDHRFLEHYYLKDISCMDAYETTLATISSNGNIVIWDADTSEVLYLLNTSTSTRIHMADKRAQGQTGSLPAEKSQCSAPCKKSTTLAGNKTDVNISALIMCLKTREVNADTATMLNSENGYIYAWSVISKGGLLGKFRAVNAEGAGITTMSTDVNEQILLTGDSTGKICLWDIQGFGFKQQTDKGPFEDIKGWHVSLCPPPLLRSWRSHLTAVVSVQCDPACKNVITAGLDCNVRLWTNTGCCIGVFGKDQWDAAQLCREENADQEQAGRAGTAETQDSQMPFLESPRSSSPISPLPYFEDLYDRIKEATTTPKNMPILSHDQLLAKCGQLLKLKPGFDKKKGIHLLHLLPENDKNSTQQSSSEDQQRSKNTSTRCPPNTTPTTGCTNATDSSLHMQQSAGAVKQGFEQSSPQTASLYLNQTRSKYGHVHKIQQRDALKGSVLTPCPPNTLPGKQGSDLTPKHVHFPPISDTVPLTYSQSETQLKPHPPQTSLTTGRTNATKSSPRLSRGRH